MKGEARNFIDSSIVSFWKGIRRIGRWFVLALFIVSAAFGFLKQAKVAFRSFDAMRGPHEEAGASVRWMRDELFRQKDPTYWRAKVFSYTSDRIDEPGHRPAIEYYYDAQYGLAPLPLEFFLEEADFFLLDFVSQNSLQTYCRERKLSPLIQKGNLALVKRDSS